MTQPASTDIRLVPIPNLYGQVRCIKVMEGREAIGEAVMFSPARGRGVVWMMGCRALEAEIEFPVIVSDCGNAVSLSVSTEAMLAAVEAKLHEMIGASAPALMQAAE